MVESFSSRNRHRFDDMHLPDTTPIGNRIFGILGITCSCFGKSVRKLFLQMTSFRKLFFRFSNKSELLGRVYLVSYLHSTSGYRRYGRGLMEGSAINTNGGRFLENFVQAVTWNKSSYIYCKSEILVYRHMRSINLKCVADIALRMAVWEVSKVGSVSLKPVHIWGEWKRNSMNNYLFLQTTYVVVWSRGDCYKIAMTSSVLQTE